MKHEAAFSLNIKASDREVGGWVDWSDSRFHRFVSPAGSLQLRKRLSYPASWAYAQGSVLYAGYGDPEHAQLVLSQNLDDIDEELFYDEEFMLLAADCRTGETRMQRDAFCTLPVFRAQSGDKLVLASDLAAACRLLGRAKLHQDNLGVMETLLRWPTHARTLFREISIVYDRQRLLWHDGHASLQQPPDAGPRTVAQRRRDADPRLFAAFLEETLDRYWHRYSNGRQIACDLSGGYDSTAVTGYSADKGYPLLAGSLIYPGEAGRTQSNKLAALRRRFNFESVLAPMEPATDYPLSAMASIGQWRPFYPTSVLYEALHTKLAQVYANRGIDVLFTGVGGDELFQNIVDDDFLQQGSREMERRKHAPVARFAGSRFNYFFETALQEAAAEPPLPTPLLPYQSIQSISSYDAYIGQGIWPVHPLSDPRLYAYCQSLPIEFRHNKEILRAYLKARRFPSVVHDKPAKESFSGFFDMSIGYLKPVMQRFFATSHLAGQGLVDQSVVLEMLHDMQPGEGGWLELYMLLVVEINLQKSGTLIVN